MKNRTRIILIILLLFVGLSLMLYPAVSNYLHEKNHVRVIETYENEVNELHELAISEKKVEAVTYNTQLANLRLFGHAPADSENCLTQYERMLDMGDGIMGYIRIPVCGIALPVKHGVADDTLADSAGHLMQTSLPIGGYNTHAVISAHRGLPSAKLFTSIDKLKEGDLFYIHVLDEVLAYKVIDIKVVLPEEVGELEIEEGKDFVTLLTCTPYGINTHRLLVKGERTEYVPDTEEAEMQQEMSRQTYMRIAYAIGVILAIAVLVVIYIWRRKRLRKGM